MDFCDNFITFKDEESKEVPFYPHIKGAEKLGFCALQDQKVKGPTGQVPSMYSLISSSQTVRHLEWRRRPMLAMGEPCAKLKIRERGSQTRKGIHLSKLRSHQIYLSVKMSNVEICLSQIRETSEW